MTPHNAVIALVLALHVLAGQTHLQPDEINNSGINDVLKGRPTQTQIHSQSQFTVAVAPTCTQANVDVHQVALLPFNDTDGLIQETLSHARALIYCLSLSRPPQNQSFVNSTQNTQTAQFQLTCHHHHHHKDQIGKNDSADEDHAETITLTTYTGREVSESLVASQIDVPFPCSPSSVGGVVDYNGTEIQRIIAAVVQRHQKQDTTARDANANANASAEHQFPDFSCVVTESVNATNKTTDEATILAVQSDFAITSHNCSCAATTTDQRKVFDFRPLKTFEKQYQRRLLTARQRRAAERGVRGFTPEVQQAAMELHHYMGFTSFLDEGAAVQGSDVLKVVAMYHHLCLIIASSNPLNISVLELGLCR